MFTSEEQEIKFEGLYREFNSNDSNNSNGFSKLPVVKNACKFDFEEDILVAYEDIEIQTTNVKESDHSDVTNDVHKSEEEESTEGGSKKINEDDDEVSNYIPSESEQVVRK